MSIRKITLFTLTLISLSIFSQNDYPKKLVVNNDTVCAISIDQVKVIDAVFIDRNECEETRDSLYSQVNSYKNLVSLKDTLIRSRQKQIQVQDQIIDEYVKITSNDKKIIEEKEKKIKWLKIQRNVLTIIALSLGIVVIL